MAATPATGAAGCRSSGAAGRADVAAALRTALADGGGPLLVYMALHGERGETARDDEVDLWGGARLSVANLAALLDGAPPRRQVRLVIASCFSGGFADLAFAGAHPQGGAARTPRCGLFASEWDQESSGCDPNPDRRAQEGFSVHFLHALRGEDRDGKPLPAAEIDYDGDGRVSLLEAETRARIASRSIDVPTRPRSAGCARSLRRTDRRGRSRCQKTTPSSACWASSSGW